MNDHANLQYQATHALAVLDMTRDLLARIVEGDRKPTLLPLIYSNLASVRKMLEIGLPQELISSEDMAELDKTLGGQEGISKSRSFSEQMERFGEIQRLVDTLPSTTLGRIKAAMNGALPVSELSTDELAIFDDLVSIEQWQRGVDGNAEFAAELLKTPGNVGYDDGGNLVETVGDGKSYSIIRPASGAAE